MLPLPRCIVDLVESVRVADATTAFLAPRAMPRALAAVMISAAVVWLICSLPEIANPYCDGAALVQLRLRTGQRIQRAIMGDHLQVAASHDRASRDAALRLRLGGTLKFYDRKVA